MTKVTLEFDVAAGESIDVAILKALGLSAEQVVEVSEAKQSPSAATAEVSVSDTTEAPKRRGRPPKGEVQAAAPAPAPVPASEETKAANPTSVLWGDEEETTVEEPAQPAYPPATQTDMRQVIEAVCAVPKLGPDAVKGLFSAFGVTAAKQLYERDYPAFVAKAKALLATAK